MLAIDLGSNTIRFLEVDKDLIEIKTKEVVVRTAQDLHKTNLVSQNALERIVKAIKEAQNEFCFDNVVAITTAALRVAKNQKEALNYIYKKTDVKFCVISGELEAKLTTLAIVDIASKYNYKAPFLMLDIGGGSTEIAFYDDSHIISKSFNFGIVTVAEQTRSKDEIIKFLNPFVEDINLFLSNIDISKINFFASTAGTPTTLAAIKHNLTYKTYDKKIVNGTTLDLNEIKDIYNNLINLPLEKMEKLTGTNRGDLIIAGITILEEILKITKQKEIIVFDNGLREGIIIGKKLHLLPNLI